MNYYISDLHLFHKNVTNEGSNFDNRPFDTLEEIHKVIKKNWNSKITNADHVYILGDLAWKENEDVIELVSTLRGNKHLILGNHDKATDQRYKQLFVEIANYKEAKDVIDGKEYHVVMSHFPLAFGIISTITEEMGKSIKCGLFTYMDTYIILWKKIIIKRISRN